MSKINKRKDIIEDILKAFSEINGEMLASSGRSLSQSKKVQLTRKDVSILFKAINRVMIDYLIKGETFSIVSLIKIYVIDKPEHKSRNPRTGEQIISPASQVVKAKISKVVGKQVRLSKHDNIKTSNTTIKKNNK